MFKTMYWPMLLALCWMRDTRAATSELPDMPVVKVTGHYENPVGASDAASQGTITADLIADRPALRTGEILEFVPA